MGKTLILYYSCNGSTRRVARELQRLTGGELQELELRDKYTTATAYTIGLYHIRSGKCPELLAPADVSGYDTVYLGTPVWYFTASPPVMQALRANSWQGKTLIPFCTYRGQKGKVFKRIAELAAGADVKAGHAFCMVADKADSVLQYEIRNWLAEIK